VTSIPSPNNCNVLPPPSSTMDTALNRQVEPSNGNRTAKTNDKPTSTACKCKDNRPTWPWGVQKVKAPGYLENRHVKLVSLSALRTGRLYSQENSGTLL
jgi:hypothetical protein